MCSEAEDFHLQMNMSMSQLEIHRARLDQGLIRVPQA